MRPAASVLSTTVRLVPPGPRRLVAATCSRRRSKGVVFGSTMAIALRAARLEARRPPRILGCG
jgi:hypothetical protein